MPEEDRLIKQIDDLRILVAKYEQNGPAKLYYSLNRKAWEMADLMNSTNLKNIDIDDPKSKTFDRLKAVWQDASSIAAAVKALGDMAGITGDEEKDIIKNHRTTPESIADVLGDNKQQFA